MFDVSLFKQQLNTSWLGQELLHFEELPSTNSYAKKLESSSGLHGSVILTDFQTSGRGQYNRIWKTEPGQNLTFSLVLEPKENNRFIVLTLACALAIAEVCEQETKSKFDLKWPNDVVQNGQKICGLLTEAVYNGNEVDRVVIGIGLNVNQEKFQEELSQTATSLYKFTEKDSSREALLARIFSKLEYYYRLWEVGELELIKRINKKLIGYGHWAQLTVDGNMLEGEFKFLGVNETGALLVLNKELEVNTFSYEQVRVHFDPQKS